jgi:hypothetical protein
MKTLFTIVFIFIVGTNNLSAQHFFNFPKPAKKELARKPFSKVRVLDKRIEKDAVARLKFNAHTGLELINTRNEFSEALAEYCHETLETAGPTEQDLTIIVYRFFAEELDTNTNGNREYGRFRFSADFFVGDRDGKYRLVGIAEESATAKGYNVTDELISLAGNTIQSAYRNARKQAAPSSQSFTSDFVEQYDLATISQAQPFTGVLPELACYDTWNDFLAMRRNPEMTVSVGEKPKTVGYYRVDRKGKTSKLYTNPGKIFVYNGKVYYGLRSTYWELNREHQSYYVTLPVYVQKKGPGSASVIAFGIIGGIVGGMIASGTNQDVLEYYRCKVDSRTGELVPLEPVSGLKDCSPHLSVQ